MQQLRHIRTSEIDQSVILGHSEERASTRIVSMLSTGQHLPTRLCFHLSPAHSSSCSGTTSHIPSPSFPSFHPPSLPKHDLDLAFKHMAIGQDSTMCSSLKAHHCYISPIIRHLQTPFCSDHIKPGVLPSTSVTCSHTILLCSNANFIGSLSFIRFL